MKNKDSTSICILVVQVCRMFCTSSMQYFVCQGPTILSKIFALQEGPGHEGSKAQRVLFTFDDKFLFTTGFSRMSERQYACWDAVCFITLCFLIKNYFCAVKEKASRSRR